MMNSFGGFFVPFLYPLGGHFNGPFIAVYNAHPRKTRISTSLQIRKKKQRDSERMASFLNRKDSENLPFFDIEYDDLQRLTFNSLLRKTSCQTKCRTVIKELENKVSGQTACISFLKLENSDLKISAQVQNSKCLDLCKKKLDSVREKSQKTLETKQNKITELEKCIKKKDERNKNMFEFKENVMVQKACLWRSNMKLEQKVDSLSEENSELKQIVRTLSEEIQRFSQPSQAPKITPRVRGLIPSITNVLVLLITNMVDRAYQDERQFFCIKCGIRSNHPQEDCPAKRNNCAACKKKGHYTLLCRNLYGAIDAQQ